MATVNDTYILRLIKQYAMTHESKKIYLKKGNVANFTKYDFHSYNISYNAGETICWGRGPQLL